MNTEKYFSGERDSNINHKMPLWILLCTFVNFEIDHAPLATSQVFDKILQLHLPLGLDVGAVHVCIEEDDRERQDEDGVRVPELPNHSGVADAVALAADTKQEIENRQKLMKGDNNEENIYNTSRRK